MSEPKAQKIRLYKVAAEINLSSESLMEFLQKKGYEVKTINTIITEEMMNDIKTHFKKDIEKAEKHQKKVEEFQKKRVDYVEQVETKEKQPIAEEVKVEEPVQVEVQETNEEQKSEIIVEEEPQYFVAVEEMPEPIGGIQAIQSKIVYPEIAKRAGVEGKVYVLAFVDENGNVTKVTLTKGIGAGCDEAAMEAVRKTKFKPGKQRGKPVKVQVQIPVEIGRAHV